MLTMPQRNRILKDVILGTPASQAEDDEARQWRKHCEHDVAKCKEQGFMPEIPFDVDDEDSEGGEGAPPETFRGA